MGREERWKTIGERMSKWCKAIQKWMDKSGADESYREISWALEAHESGYPHAHVVMSHPVPEQERKRKTYEKVLKRAWWRVWGVGWSRCWVERPRHPGRASRYLAKYIGKMRGWTEELLAILYRKRMWGTSLKRTPDQLPAAPQWHVEEVIGELQAVRKVSEWYRLLRVRRVDARGVEAGASADGVEVDCERYITEWHAVADEGRLMRMARALCDPSG